MLHKIMSFNIPLLYNLTINLDTLTKKLFIELNLHMQIIKFHYDLLPKGKQKHL